MTTDDMADWLAGVHRDHNRRLSRIDPRLAPVPPLDGPTLVTVRRPGGSAAGCVRTHRYDEGAHEALWGALCRHTLRIHVGGTDPSPAFEEVVAGLVDQVHALPDHADDCAIRVVWPSLDTACAAPLVRHGFAPLTVLVCTRLGEHRHPAATVTVRAATLVDVDWLADQAWRLHRFEVELGALPDRPDLRARLREELSGALAGEADFVLVADVNGARVGFIHGQVPCGAWIEQQVTMKSAGYLSRLFVEPGARRAFVGRSLVSASHSVLRENGAEAVMLHHSLHNPFATPLWAGLGYRPVFTTWSKAVRVAPRPSA